MIKRKNAFQRFLASITRKIEFEDSREVALNLSEERYSLWGR